MIKKVFPFILVLFYGINLYAQNNRTVRFDGIYQSENKIGEDYHSFLRFYNDSTVISVTSSGVSSDVIKWFYKPFDDSGKYEIIENKIYFSCTSKYGTVVYEGTLESDFKLNLKVKSLINGNEFNQVFYFIKI